MRDVDVDWVIVDRACSGRKVQANLAERREIIRRMNAAGRSDTAIAAVLGTGSRRVWALREQLGLPAVSVACAPSDLAGVRKRRLRAERRAA